MTYFQVTNLLGTSLTVEDLGIILPAGGRADISADSRARSQDLRRVGRHVRVDTVYVPPGRRTAFAPSAMPPAPAPPAPARDAEIAALDAKLDRLLSAVSLLGAAQQAVVQTAAAAQAAPAKDPMYVPRTIVPDAEARMAPAESVMSKDVGASRDQLRKARKGGAR